jgi:hypothetical protein
MDTGSVTDGKGGGVDETDTHSKAHCKKALTLNGTYVSVVGDGNPVVRIEDLNFLKELNEAGQIHAVIYRCNPLEQIVEAHNIFHWQPSFRAGLSGGRSPKYTHETLSALEPITDRIFSAVYLISENLV